MTTSISNRVTVKLFVGCLLTSEIRMYLKQSREWKQVQIVGDSERVLLETHFQDKDYLGQYLSKTNITLKELKLLENTIQKLLVHFCPELSQETIKIYIFPQVFIT